MFSSRWQIRAKRLLEVLCLSAVLCFIPRIVAAAEIETRLYDLDPSTFYPTPETVLKLNITRTDSCFSVETNSLLVDQNNGIVRVSFDIGPADFGLCPFPAKLELPIGVLSQEGPYQIYVYQENRNQGEYFDSGFLQGVIDVEVTATNWNVNPETPAEFDGGFYEIQLSPSSPTTASNTTLIASLSHSACIGITPNGVRINSIARTVDVSLDFLHIDFSGPGCPVPTGPVEIALGVLPRVGSYQVSIFDDSQSLQPGVVFDSENYVGSFDFTVSSPNAMVSPETPAAGSNQSGVGLVRGWACDASRVEVQFDDLPPIKVAYGTSRADTNAICGDDDNGYGMVFAWGLLGHGPHTMATFIDGVEISRVDFAVTGLDEAFIQGLSGTYELADFPSPGQSVTVQWSEADQNFIITGYNR